MRRKKFHGKIEIPDEVKQIVENEKGGGISDIEAMPEGQQKTASITGAKVCVRSGGYLAAMIARSKQGDAYRLTIDEDSYRKAHDYVQELFHRVEGNAGVQICGPD